MDDHVLAVINILYRELESVRQKGRMVDGWAFKLISVGGVPLFLLIGYSFIEPKYKEIILAMPLISSLSLLLVANMVNHYSSAIFYMKYLEKRLNMLLKRPVIYESACDNAFYRGSFTIVRLSFLFGVGLLAIINITLYPVINTIIAYRIKDIYMPQHIKYILLNYWEINSAIFAIVIIIWVGSYYYAKKRSENILFQYEHTIDLHEHA